MRSELTTTELDPIDAYSRRNEFWQGVKATFPLVGGAAPFGLIFGAVAVSGGLSSQATAAMSAFVFAGSAQFVAAGLWRQGRGSASSS
jgi:predicted branched-subunit amino acid permease